MTPCPGDASHSASLGAPVPVWPGPLCIRPAQPNLGHLTGLPCGAGQPASRARTARANTANTANMRVEAAGPDAPLVISFGFAQGSEPVNFDFVRRLHKLAFILGRPSHRTHLRDPGLAWCLQGVPGLGCDLSDTLLSLKPQIHALTPTPVITLGPSMGGEGAILHGLALKADRIVAFGPLSTMNPEVARRHRDARWLSVMERLDAASYSAMRAGAT